MLLFDIEANALHDPTVVHCIAIAEVGHKPRLYYGEGVQEAVNRLVAAPSICAHNGMMYDVPVIERLYGVKLPYCHDTLIWSRFLYPDMYNHPCGTGKPNSLKKWGLFFGHEKGDYGGGWDEYNDDMGTYCIRDVEVLDRIVTHLRPMTRPFKFALKLEHVVAKRLFAQIQHGICFDVESAERLLGELLTEQAAIDDEFAVIFEPLPKQLKTKVKYISFNPNSGKMFAARLKSKYEWKATKFTEKGNIIMDAVVLATLPYPEARLMQRRQLIKKRIEALTNWIKAYEARGDQRIHGWVNSIGAVSHRMSHSGPNLAQVPRVGSPYGEECRALFRPTAGRVMVGADLSGIELRLLSNRMWEYDDGEYAEIVVNGDPHTFNQEAAELAERPKAKNGIYCLLYGGGDEKLGNVVGRPGEGKEVRATWMKNIPALAKVIAHVKGMTKKHGYVVLLDGRRAPVRSPHMALNTQIQGDAAVLHKMAMVLACSKLRDWDCDMLLNIHDEQQYECDPGIAEDVGKLLVGCMEEAGKILKVRTPITGEYKVGYNWKETH